LFDLLYSGSSFRRFHLTIKELFSTGVMSLIIIIVAGCLSAWCWVAGL